jgi:Tfp pilus assembly PilM family ATPase
MKFNKIFEAFPTPKFLDIPFAGLSISDSAVRCIQFGRKGGKLYIEKYTEKTILPNTIVSGQINNQDEVVRILSEVKKELNLSYVKISLPEERAYLFTAKIPVIEQKEIRSAVESKIEENVPVSPLELVFDYNLYYHKQKEHLDVCVSALPRTLVDQYVDMANKSGLSLLTLEIESQAIIRSLLPPHAEGTVLVVHFSPDKVGLYVSSFRLVCFTSTITTREQSSNSSSVLVQEIKKLFTYWHTLKDNIDKEERKISQVIVCGEKFEDSMISFLSSHIEVPVVVGNVWTNVLDIDSTLPEITFSDSLRYAASVGLALPGEVLI